MMDPLSYFLFQPVLHNWCNKGYGTYKRSLLLIEKSNPWYVLSCLWDDAYKRKSSSCGRNGFPISLSEWSFTICLPFFSANHPNCTKFHSLKCTHISLWLNPTGHSKFHNTLNHPPPATDSGRTACTPLYPPVQAVPPYSLTLFFFLSCGKAGTCAHDRHEQQTACSECPR